MKRLLVFTFLFVQIGAFAQKIDFENLDEKNPPKVVVNHLGKNYRLPNEVLLGVDPESIKSINVFKGNSAAAILAESAEDGLIMIDFQANDLGNKTFESLKDQLTEINLLKTHQKTVKVNTIPEEEFINIHSDVNGNPVRFNSELTKEDLEKVLVVVELNDKKSKVVKGGLEKLDYKLIQSVNVLNSPFTYKKHNSKGKEGIILIRLKTSVEAKEAYKKLK